MNRGQAPKGPKKKKREVSVAEAVDKISWDYEPEEEEEASGPVTTHDYFEDFPWDAEDGDD